VPGRRFVLAIGGREVRLKAHKCHLDGGPPGNSLAALRACLDADVEQMEIDVCALADGEFLVTHGPDLAHETTARGLASQLDAAGARRLHFLEAGRAGAHGVPLLRDLLPELRGSGRLQLDLKDERLPAQTLDALAEQIAPHVDRLVVGGGCAPTLRALQARLPDLAMGFDPLLLFDLRRGDYAGPLAPPPADLGRGALAETFERLWSEAPSAGLWYLRGALIARLAADGFDAIGWLRARDVEVDAWTIDVQPGPGKRQWSVDLMRRIADLGAAQVTTNTPLAWLGLMEMSAL
jgi:glycerophosphoryl diester phosphodiesterase